MQDTSVSQVFQFEEAFADLLAEHRKDNEAPMEDSPTGGAEHLVLQALVAAGEAAYHWDIASDAMSWSANAATVLGCPTETVASGRLYASLLNSENQTSRYETVMHANARDHGQGVSFQIEYVFCPQGRDNAATIRFEDNGTWQAGDDGIPKVVFGTIRRRDLNQSSDPRPALASINDPLTGMLNRGGMTDALADAIKASQKSAAHCAFAIAAINNLDLVKETYGYNIADEVILSVGRHLKQILRSGDSIASYATGKFGLILNDCNDSDLQPALARFAAKVRTSLIETSRGPVWTTISFGAVMLPQNADTAELAISRAEEALSEAARSPSEASTVYQHSERREVEREFNSRCAAELVKCLREGSFRLAYQPIVDAKTRLPVMHEALLRMPDGQDFLGATHLIPLAERLGLVRQIDHAVMLPVMQALHDHPELHLTMNVSATTVADTFWHDQLIEVLDAHSTAARRLTIEIGEVAALTNLKPARRFMERLREAGASIAIEHFGQGYASIRHLRELPVNMLKLDGTLCRNLTTQSDNEYLVKSLLELTAKSDIKTVAEWVETSEDADVLTLYGANYLQGHYFGQPSLDQHWNSNKTATFDIATQQPSAVVQEISEPSEIKAKPDLAEPTTIESEPALDFSVIDDSIAKLRDALSGLSAAANTTSSEDDAVHAA